MAYYDNKYNPHMDKENAKRGSFINNLSDLIRGLKKIEQECTDSFYNTDFNINKYEIDIEEVIHIYNYESIKIFQLKECK